MSYALPAPDIPDLRTRALLPVLVFTGFVVSIVATLGAPMIPTIARAQGVSLETAQWLLTVTLLVGAVATPINGRLADGPRRKQMILLSLGLVLVGAVISALSNSFTPFIAGRAMQGVGQAIIPLTIATARDFLPKDRARSGIAALSVTTAAGVGLGYPITGLIARWFDYHAGFWFAAMVTAAAFVLVLIVVPENRSAPSHPLDIAGALLLSASLLALLLAISQGGTWGWSSTRIYALAGAGLVLLVIWVIQELRTRHPLIELRLLSRRMVLAADLISLLMGVSLYAMSSLVNRYMQTPAEAGFGFQSSLLVTGLTLTPLSIGSILASRLSGRLTQRFGVGIVLALGSTVMGLDMLYLALTRSARWEIVIATFMLGVGVGLTFAMMPGLIIRSVPAHETGSANGLNGVLRLVGGAIGSAASIAILSAHHPAGQAYPDDHGYTVAFLAGAALCAIAALTSLALIGRGQSLEDVVPPQSQPAVTSPTVQSQRV